MSDTTREEYDALIAAINSGAGPVTYANKTVAYRSLGEMMMVARRLERQLGISPRKKVTRLIYKDPRAL